MALKIIDVATQTTSEEILEKINTINIGKTDDDGGTQEDETIMAK